MKSIVLAEKPSVARDLARVLNCGKKNKGFFEGSKYLVTWAMGHLVTLAEPEDYNPKYREWRMEDLPMLPEKMTLKVMRRTSHQFKTISHLMKRNDVNELIIATDAGREGELVARWIMKLAGWKKPIRRLWISSQTDQSIREGFASLKPGRSFDNLYQAAVCRAEADWLIGLNVTRALTCKHNAQLTAGRVQTPTLSMIIHREREIQEFSPVDYWTIQADFGDIFGNWRNEKGNSRIFSRNRAEEIAAKTRGATGVVRDVRTERKSQPPPLAYDLTELQRDANRRFSFSAKQTLSILQILYERYKIVTYPRTDSRYITSDMVSTLPNRLRSISVEPYTHLVTPLLKKKLTPSKRFVNDSRVTDHHAVIPTEQSPDLKALAYNERQIYDLIVRRFIAVLYPSFRYDQTTIVIEVNGERFYSRGKVVKEKGWRDVTSLTSLEESPDEDSLPEQSLKQEQRGSQKPVVQCTINQSKTKAPPQYTEATLLTAMECPGKWIEDEELRESIKQGGLGTPATRAEIIEKLLHNYYIERHGKKLVPTSKGFQLIDLVPADLKSPELTAQWELRLSLIARGNERNRDFMTDIRDKTVALVKIVREDTATFKADNVTKTKCPMCGKLMLQVKGKKGKMLVCPDRECGHRQSEKQDDLDWFKRSKRERRTNAHLISQYSDNTGFGTNLGDLLKDALEKKKGKK